MKKVETYLVFVSGDGINSNKFYKMTPTSDGEEFKVEYGRVGKGTPQKTSYPMSKWNRKYGEKLKKGYRDITDLKQGVTVEQVNSNNLDFDKFYEVFSAYASNSVRTNYLVNTTTAQQLAEAQKQIDTALLCNTVMEINEHLTELFKIVPRRMDNVSDYLINSISDKDQILAREQDAIDGMDSSNIIHTVNPFKELNIEFEELDKSNWSIDILELLKTNNTEKSVHKLYKITKNSAQDAFNNWVTHSKNKTTKLLIHGTRNANIFSILKSDLLVRPSNAVSFAGSVYGDGCYFASSFMKSMNYTGYDSDKLFLLSKVHQGLPFHYKGWYYESDNQLKRRDMNYEYLKSKGYDSLYVESGGNLQRDEYISYNTSQNVIDYLVWMK